MVAARTKAGEYWKLHRSAYRNTMIYAHATSLTVATCNISLCLLMLPAHDAGDYVELILLYTPPS